MRLVELKDLSNLNKGQDYIINIQRCILEQYNFKEIHENNYHEFDSCSFGYVTGVGHGEDF